MSVYTELQTRPMLMPGRQMPALMSGDTREAWLQRLVTRIRPWYEGELPSTVHTSVSFPSSGIRSNTIGECWHAHTSADHCPQVFIHPKMGDGVEVAAVMVHELIHACRPEAKHGKDFKKVALRLGLTGKMTATVAGDELRATLDGIVRELGPYPHPQLRAGIGIKPKQSTRMIKCQCETCDYTVRTTRKWLEVGLPRCPEGDVMVPADDGDGE